MRTSRFTDEQIIGIVREYEAGAKLTELCRRHNISPTTFYKWRAKYGGMAVSDAKRLRALEEENRRLKQLLAESHARQPGAQGAAGKKLVTPAARRQAVAIAQEEHGLSRRRACRLIGIARSVVEREPKRARDHARLRERLRALAGERRRFGYRRLHELLRREGWRANHKLVERLYREEKLAIRRRGRQKRGGGSMAGHWCPIAANQRWSLDFTEDCLANGRKFRTANLKDDCTRECPAIVVDFSLPGRRVVAMLEDVAKVRGHPDMLVVDNGPELRGRELDRWAYEHGVRLFFIDPGKPMQNGSIESFNGRFREECLDQSWFTSLAEARRVIEAWRLDYNLHRPHTSLRMRTPAAFAAARPFVKRQTPPTAASDTAPPPEAVAAISAPMLSGSSGFS